MGSGASKDSSDDEDEKVLVISKSLLISLIQLENKYLLPTYLFINFQILWKSMNYKVWLPTFPSHLTLNAEM